MKLWQNPVDSAPVDLRRAKGAFLPSASRGPLLALIHFGDNVNAPSSSLDELISRFSDFVFFMRFNILTQLSQRWLPKPRWHGSPIPDPPKPQQPCGPLQQGKQGKQGNQGDQTLSASCRICQASTFAMPRQLS